jgi:hypothetical protein
MKKEADRDQWTCKGSTFSNALTVNQSSFL